MAGANPEVVERLTALMNKYIVAGRSTGGAPQKNDVALSMDGTGSKRENRKKARNE